MVSSNPCRPIHPEARGRQSYAGVAHSSIARSSRGRDVISADDATAQLAMAAEEEPPKGLNLKVCHSVAVGGAPTDGPVLRSALSPHTLHERPFGTNFQNIYSIFEAAAARRPSRPCFGTRFRADGSVGPFSWQTYEEVAARVQARSAALANVLSGYNLTSEGQEELMAIQYLEGQQYHLHCDGSCDGRPRGRASRRTSRRRPGRTPGPRPRSCGSAPRASCCRTCGERASASSPTCASSVVLPYFSAGSVVSMSSTA